MMPKTLLSIVLALISCKAAFACYGQILTSGITQEDKKIILQEHNRLRQIVATGRYPGQPGAENMREIFWDDELAARAQKWADNCQFRHDPRRTINRFTMGQNLAIIWSTAPLEPNDGDFPSRIQSWFNEVQKYSFGDAWSPKTGHYSQLVWGETNLVGCGFAEYKDSVKYNKLYVCNYGPGGNVVGYNPYQVGKPACASYGMNPSPHYQGLCAVNYASSSGISSNTIETYEYKQTKAFNNKQTAYSTQFPQPASSSYPKQASTFAKPAAGSSGPRKAYPTAAGHLKYKNLLEAYKPSPAEFQKAVLKHTILSTYLNQNNKNKPPSSSPQIDLQLQQQEQQPQETGIENQPEVYIVEEQPSEATTPKPVKRGWSLLTWRG